MSNSAADYHRKVDLSAFNQHHRNGTDTPRDHCDAPQRNKALSNDSGIIILQNTESLSNSGAELVAAASRNSNLVTGLNQHYEEKKKRKFEGGTDRPALICDFFAKGWCTNGNSCRFLHQGKTSFAFPGSIYEDAYGSPISADFQHSVGHNTEMSSYSWEPSTPFQPSFPLTQSLLSSVKRFNSIRDNMEKPGEGHFRVSDACCGSLECNTSEQPLGADHNVYDNISNEKNYGNDLVPIKTRISVTSIIEMRNTIATPEEEKLLGSTHLQDLTKRGALNTENDCATQIDKQKTETADMAGREADVEIGDYIAKNFRTVLIDYVKELVRPIWLEGKLSKDAHNKIVKKTVDKVRGAVKQLPSTLETVDPFSSSLEQNIANFVVYYLGKYGKLHISVSDLKR